MQAIRTAPDKNGAFNIIVSGNTVLAAPNAALVIEVGGRAYDGGLVDGNNEYRRAIPNSDAASIEVWTVAKVESERTFIDSCAITDELVAVEEAEVDEPAEEAVPVKKSRKKAV